LRAIAGPPDVASARERPVQGSDNLYLLVMPKGGQ